MMRPSNFTHLFSAILLLVLTGCSLNQERSSAPAASLDQIKNLAGRWESAPDKEGNKEVAIYKVTSAGTAVEEVLFPGTDYEMVSMYHTAGDRIAMTHYCAIGNQPYLIGETVSPTKIIFRYVSGVNVNPNKDMHIHELHLTWHDQDHIRQEWIAYQDGKAQEAKIVELVRVKS